MPTEGRQPLTPQEQAHACTRLAASLGIVLDTWQQTYLIRIMQATRAAGRITRDDLTLRA